MKQKRQYIQPDYAEYERQKREWVRLNPNATHEQYQQAMTKLARKLGV